MLTTNQKGALAETAIAHEAIKLGIGVYRPLGDERCDLIFDLRPRLMRVQCKWASRRGDVIVVQLYSSRRTADGLRRTYYSPTEIDAFAAYAPDTGSCYFVEFAQIGVIQALHLRLEPAKNNQSKGLRWAREFEFGATLRPLLGP
jgi:PD-(D/E)XK endonuclease